MAEKSVDTIETASEEIISASTVVIGGAKIKGEGVHRS